MQKAQHKMCCANALAEKVGFEPTRRVNGLRDFESRLFDHLSTSPYSFFERALKTSNIITCVCKKSKRFFKNNAKETAKIYFRAN